VPLDAKLVALSAKTQAVVFNNLAAPDTLTHLACLSEAQQDACVSELLCFL